MANDETEGFLAGYPPEIQEISRALRQLILAAQPEAREILYASQNHFDYSLSGKARDGLIYLCPLHDYVRLGFYYGGGLADPAHLLIGEGKRLRHVKVRSIEEAQRPEVAALVREAWEKAPLNDGG